MDAADERVEARGAAPAPSNTRKGEKKTFYSERLGVVLFEEKMADSELIKLTDILGDMAAEVKKKEKKSVRKLRAEAEWFQALWGFNAGQPVKNAQVWLLLKSFEEEMVKDARKRVLHPDVKWGPSIIEQFLQARKGARFRENLQTIRKLYGSELTRRQMRVIAFIRTDRQLTERLRQEAEDDGQILADGFWVVSVAALLAGDTGNNGPMYRVAKRRRLMLQTNGQGTCQLMRRPSIYMDYIGGA